MRHMTVAGVAVALWTAAASGAVWIVDGGHAGAADTNAGTREAPLKTIAAAALKVQPGDEVIVRPGTYREAVTLRVSGRAGAPIVFRSEVPQAAVISGSDVVTNWQAAAPGIWLAPVPRVRKVDYLGGNPQWIYFNGLPLERAETRDRLIPGTFHLDLAAQAVLVSPPEGSALDQARVEYACREGLMAATGRLDHIVIDGFTLEHNADWFRGSPALRIKGRYWRVENNLIRWSSYVGLLSHNSSDCIVRSNTIEWVGCQAIGGGRNLRLLVEGNTIRHNNWRMFNWGNEGGGSKWTTTLDSVFRGNTVCFNYGPGLWVDGANDSNLFERNLCHDNTVRSIFTEISWDDIIQDNVVFNTGENGILVSHSPGVLVRRNVVFNNGTAIGLGGTYSRGNDHDQKWYPTAVLNIAQIPDIEPLRVLQWEANFLKYFVAPKAAMLNNCVVWDNLIFDNGIALMEGRDYRTPSKIDGFVNNLSDHNLFWARDERDLFCVGYKRAYTNLVDWRKQSERDEHSVFADPRAAGTTLPGWAAARRAEWDLKMRPIAEIQGLGLALVSSPMAQEAMGRMLRASSVKPLKLSDARVKAFIIEADGHRTLAVWTTQVAERRYLRLRLNKPTVTVENGYMARAERTLPGGCIDLLVTYNPTYVHGVSETVVEAPSGILTVRAFNLADQPVPASVVFANDGAEPVTLKATFTPSAGFTVVPATLARKLAPGETWEAPLAVTPDGSVRKGAGMLRMAATVGPDSINRVAVFTIGEGENKLPAAPKPPTVDGRLEDWGALVASRVPLAMIGDASQCLTGNTNAWKGPADLSARLYGAWTTQAVHLAVVVTDDRVLAGDAAVGDSIAISLDGRAPDMQWQQDLTRGCYHAVIRPLSNGQASLVPTWSCQGMKGVTAAAVLSSTGYVVEFTIPLTAGNFPAGDWSPGRPIRLSVLVNDVDDPAPGTVPRTFGWGASPKGDNDTDTSGWATVLLEAP